MVIKVNIVNKDKKQVKLKIHKKIIYMIFNLIIIKLDLKKIQELNNIYNKIKFNKIYNNKDQLLIIYLECHNHKINIKIMLK